MKRFLILDRDKKYCEGFQKTLQDAGIEIARLPARSSMEPRLFSSCRALLRLLSALMLADLPTIHFEISELDPAVISRARSCLNLETNRSLKRLY